MHRRETDGNSNDCQRQELQSLCDCELLSLERVISLVKFRFTIIAKLVSRIISRSITSYWSILPRPVLIFETQAIQSKKDAYHSFKNNHY